MVLTNNADWAKMARKVGGHGYRTLEADEGRVRFKNSDLIQNPHYKRFDTLGWNYRMPELTAAVAYAQLERVDELVEMRRKSADIFKAVIEGCDFLTLQKNLPDTENSYYTLGVKYNGAEKVGVSWEDFRKRYIDKGGDGFYGACSIPYLEPVIRERQFIKRLPQIYENVSYHEGICPVAERVQPKMMQFKTNYRDGELAKKKADILFQLIREIEEGAAS